MRSAFQLVAFAAFISACASGKSDPVSAARTSTRPRARDTIQVRDAELERRVARLELRVLEKETQVEQLQSRLDDTRDEVVRTMAKLETLASRAEAASAMAEADVALQSLRTNAGGQPLPEIAQASRLVQQSNAEFNRQNFGGALYLANQAKGVATSGRERAAANRGAARSGETQFAVPIRVKVLNRGNVREGPGTSFAVAFPAESGVTLTAYSYTEDWVRVSDEAGRSGWIFRALVGRP